MGHFSQLTPHFLSVKSGVTYWMKKIKPNVNYIAIFQDDKKSGLHVKICGVWKSHLKFVNPCEN